MKWTQVDSQYCSVARSLAEVGERWTLLVVRDAMLGAKRFSEFVQSSGAARNIIASRLEKLVEAGVLRKSQYQERPARYEYRLTRKGVELWPVIMALVQWGDKWHDGGEGKPMEHVHDRCGQPFHLEPHCSACHEPIRPNEVSVRPGPGTPADHEA